ncbi:MAG: wax ester/triacylglycerol synthase domain-containing protein [Stenotrophobium sp.]
MSEANQYSQDLLKQMRDWGTPRQMTPFETVMWRIEADPRMRSTITGLQILDCVPDWGRLSNAVEWSTRAVPRFRQRVLEPAFGGIAFGAPAWVDDPDFKLENHLHREVLPQPGSMRQLLDVAQQAAMNPFDRERSPWEAILVEGLEGGRAAFILKLHHSTTDGLGTIQLLNTLNSRRREHTPKPQPPPRPVKPLPSPSGLLRDQAAQLPGTLLNAASKALSPLLLRKAGSESALLEIQRYLRSAARVLKPLPAAPSPLLRGRSGDWHFEALDLPLAEFKTAAKAAGGSLNDAFIAALLGGFRRYHEHFGETLEQLPIAFPISLRSGDDPMGGNRFAGARFAAPMGERDPVERMRQIREFVLSARTEPAIDVLSRFSPVLMNLPGPALSRMIFRQTASQDLQASNVPGISHPVYLAGAQVTHAFPFGPLPGCGAMIAMTSHSGNCCVGVNVDPAAVTDPAHLAICLSEGFDEVLALGP